MMVKLNTHTRRSGPTADRMVEATLELIEENRGSHAVNLREVARRVGCAHTNVYNYFDGFSGLLCEAMRQAFVRYAAYLATGLDDELEPLAYFERLAQNAIRFPQEHPGLFRFTSLDEVHDNAYPPAVLEAAAGLRFWVTDVIMACAPDTARRDADNACLVIEAYICGESTNVLSNRTLPGDNIRERMLDNVMRLFLLLTAFDPERAIKPATYPRNSLTIPRGDEVSTS